MSKAELFSHKSPCNKNSHVPQLRFPEFQNTKHWKLKPLGDCLDYVQPTKYLVKSTAYNNSYQTPVLTAGKTFILGYTDETNGIFENNLPVIIFDDFTTATKFVDFPFKAKSSAMKILLTKNNINIKFIYEAMQMIKYEIGTHERHWISKFSRLNIQVPSLPEQQKIADCLSSLDELITAQTEKVESLKAHKKGLMQQLFPAEGKTTPKLRFPEFQDDGDWQEKKLGDIGEFKTSSVDKKIVEGQRLIQLVNYMNVYKHENISNSSIKDLMTVSANETQLNSSDLKKGDILFTPSSETPDDIGHSVVIFEDLKDTLYSYHLMRFRPKVKLDILYSHYFCNIPDVLRQISRVATGSTRFTISVGEFSKIQVNIPSLQEQQKIANCLSSLDELITAQTEKVESLKAHKKGLMQQLFPTTDEAN